VPEKIVDNYFERGGEVGSTGHQRGFPQVLPFPIWGERVSHSLALFMKGIAPGKVFYVSGREKAGLARKKIIHAHPTKGGGKKVLLGSRLFGGGGKGSGTGGGLW